MDFIYAAWRLGQPKGTAADGKPHADLKPAAGRTLFETIEQSQLPESQTYIVKRFENIFVLLNVYPYTPGHLMVLPKTAVSKLEELDDQIYQELWLAVRQGVEAVTKAFSPHGLNVGVNQGQAGGGSIPDHLHVHIVPRWSADTNFMTTTAAARILPISLDDTFDRISSAWRT